MKSTFLPLAALCFAVLLAPVAHAQDAGADIYKAKCMMCHGPDGLGNTPAGKLAKILSYKDPSIVQKPDADLAAILKTGKNKMPAFSTKLSDDQIGAVVAYIRTLQK